MSVKLYSRTCTSFRKWFLHVLVLVQQFSARANRMAAAAELLMSGGGARQQTDRLHLKRKNNGATAAAGAAKRGAIYQPMSGAVV